MHLSVMELLMGEVLSGPSTSIPLQEEHLKSLVAEQQRANEAEERLRAQAQVCPALLDQCNIASFPDPPSGLGVGQATLGQDP